MLKDEMPRIGSFLFRWRSYLPLILFPLILLELSRRHSYLGSSHVFDLAWEFFCLSLVAIGILIRCLTKGHSPKGTSGRTTKRQVADKLNTLGMYSVSRNPLYLGNLIIISGVTLAVQSLSLFVIVILAFILYYERIISAEEEFLKEKFGDEYINWTAGTPFLIPKFSQWQKPPTPFSWKRVIRDETGTAMSVIAALFMIEIVSDYFILGRLEIDPVWLVLFVFTLCAYMIVRLLRKKTKVLKVE